MSPLTERPLFEVLAAARLVYEIGAAVPENVVCAFGEDGSTLYITANDMLCRIRLTTRGLGF